MEAAAEKQAAAAAAPTGPEASGAAEEQTWSRAVRAVAIASRFLEQTCQERGLSLPQYRLLLWMRRGPRRAGELAQRAAVRRPTITALVEGLVEHGWLHRAPVEGDRRGIRLELTESGARALTETEAALGSRLRELAGAHEEPARVLDGLDALAQVLEREVERRAR